MKNDYGLFLMPLKCKIDSSNSWLSTSKALSYLNRLSQREVLYQKSTKYLPQYETKKKSYRFVHIFFTESLTQKKFIIHKYLPILLRHISHCFTNRCTIPCLKNSCHLFSKKFLIFFCTSSFGWKNLPFQLPKRR